MQKNTKTDLMLMPKKITGDSEKEFLQAQTEQAKERFMRGAESLIKGVLGKVNVVQWTKDHPYQSTSMAAGVGFIVAQGIQSFPSPEVPVQDENQKTEKPKQSSALSALLFPILFEATSDILKNTLLPFIQGMTQNFSASAEEEKVDKKEESLNSDSIV